MHTTFLSIPDCLLSELDPFEFRVYAHICHVIQQKGICKEGLLQTMQATKMSSANIRRARRNLAEKDYIYMAKNTGEAIECMLTEKGWK